MSYYPACMTYMSNKIQAAGYFLLKVSGKVNSRDEMISFLCLHLLYSAVVG